MSVSQERNETMKDIIKEEAAVIGTEINARVKARLDEFKKNHRDIYLCMSEGEYIETVKRFHKEEGRKYLAEVLGW